VSGSLPRELPASLRQTDGAVAPVIRKLVTYTEDFVREGGREQTPPVRLAAAMAVIANPYAGRWVEDLGVLANRFGPPLGELLGARAIELLDGAPVEAYGKGALVGERGDIEHGSAIIHTLRFGDPFRERADGTALLPSAEKRGACGAPLDLALKHKHDTSIRSHHWTFEVRVPDAPHADEILIVCAVASGGRPNARIGRGPADDYAE
jgi:Amino acid synthesis